MARYKTSSYKLELAQTIELQSFSQFTADLGKETKNRLTKGRRLVEILKQFCGSPVNLMSQIGILSLANQNLIIDIAVTNVQVFIHLYITVPQWALLFVGVRCVGLVIIHGQIL